ncbi:anti-sigma factor [Mycobacterium intermedium]|uniref:Anti-sigma-K factor RskA n=1 Tax=Mycobacterium intermedium TaxID=28445 RepID=A0A1E3S527_MYCIE|nr:anti-sigma factor [Mycobacterium intermedium]MCV6966926.1 anti-sigma factor [Mycobacterium intermedium]ODQ97200.1 anti-sigma factor [Mycobacterium intermedium]OPE47128.1 anti-sigma factor [Mycobacterium intermedium]ORA95685.1 anti-sigma factor [Mycobacterium intermedium]
MTDQPKDLTLLELATPYALDALSTGERADVERRVAAAPAAVATAFHDEVRAVRETMAVVSAATTAEPPAALRTAILAAIEPEQQARPQGKSPWRTRLLAVAAALVIGLAGFGLGVLSRPSTPTQTVAEQVLSAPDMKTVSRPLGNGQATVMFSRDRNAGVLVMNNVPPPSSGTVYQMWLIGANGPKSAGTMDAQQVRPTTTATVGDLGTCRALAFTVEPGTGSPQPTTPILVELPLK